jgi:phosphoadenosine phosphosulfate reductase
MQGKWNCAMYSYTYSKETGGLLLNPSPTGFSKEPRPVYAPELDLLGFANYWKYDKQTDAPYMWAEANRYWYRGRLVALLRGGDVYHAPVIQLAYVCEEWRETPNGKPSVKTVCENPDIGKTFTDKKGNVFTLDKPEPRGKLRPVDVAAMVEQNREILGWLEDMTAKKILGVYEKYANKLDIFHVAFSGGKDSCVLLDLVKSVLPRDSFVVVFGDTGMEFPDTYVVIDKVEAQCKAAGIKFYRAASHLSPLESWELFAPPSRVLRWCCSVHKSAPQTLKLREITGKQDFVGLDYVGIRAHESIARSGYEYENYGKKQKGQYSHNSILEWTSAEVWLYTYAHNLIINEAYKKGNIRAGCLFCPMSSGTPDYIRRQSYTNEVDGYIDTIKRKYDSDKRDKKHIETFITNGGWSARKNGRELADNCFRCVERYDNGYLFIDVTKPTSDWREWIKTIDEDEISYAITHTKEGYTVKVEEALLKTNPLISRLLRQVFRKSAYCCGCRVCEANCKNRCITFENNKVKIENCLKCHECHNIDSGCLLFHSLRHPQGGGKSLKSLNSFADHAPKPEWLISYFELKEDFFTEHTLGPMMFDMFKRFLKDAGLNDKNHFTSFAELISNIGYGSDTAMGLILVNLVNENPQIEWYVKNFDIGHTYERKTVEDMLFPLVTGKDEQSKRKTVNSIIKAYGRLSKTPLGTKLKFCRATVKEKGNNEEVIDMTRTTCSISDSRVMLYALYKFAEKCNPGKDKKDDYKNFTLNTLLSDNIERDGVSPTRIFGFDREAMIPLLIRLSERYPDFINATFTHDLDKISLRDDKTSKDVLKLFEGESGNG